jgi:hypothetical protein
MTGNILLRCKRSTVVGDATRCGPQARGVPFGSWEIIKVGDATRCGPQARGVSFGSWEIVSVGAAARCPPHAPGGS